MLVEEQRDSRGRQKSEGRTLSVKANATSFSASAQIMLLKAIWPSWDNTQHLSHPDVLSPEGQRL